MLLLNIFRKFTERTQWKSNFSVKLQAKRLANLLSLLLLLIGLRQRFVLSSFVSFAKQQFLQNTPGWLLERAIRYGIIKALALLSDLLNFISLLYILRSLRGLTCLCAFTSYVAAFFTCLTCSHFFTCFTHPHSLRAFIFLPGYILFMYMLKILIQINELTYDI